MKKIFLFFLFIFHCFIIYAQVTGDFRSATSGSWTNCTTWEEYDGSSWNTTINIPSATSDVEILNTHTVIIPYSGTRDCKNISIANGGKLWADYTGMTSLRYLNVYSNISCNGTIGNGLGNDDAISFNINGSNCVIDGTGSFTVNRMRKNAIGNTNLTISMNIELRFNGDALDNNQTTSNHLNIVISENCEVNCCGNGASPAGDIYIQTNDAITIYGKLIISGSLSNIPGIDGITVKSNATSTGSLITSSSGISATCERYIEVSTTAKTHFVSAPISNAKISSILDGNLGNFNAYKYDPSLGGGINSKWTRVFASTDMDLGISYTIPYSHASTTSKIICFEGILNTVTIEPAISSNQDDWNLIGNPYPCSVSPRAFLNENARSNTYIYGTLHFWDESGSPSTSDFASWTLTGTTKGNNGSGNSPDSIALGQGFFVQSQSGSPTKVTFNHDMKSAFSATFFTPEIDPVQRFYISVTDKNNVYNEILVGFTNEATEGFDNMYDAHKLKGNAFLALYSYIDGLDKEYAIQGRPYVVGRDVVKLGIDANTSGHYQFKLNRKENIPVGLKVYLIDKLTDTKVLLDELTDFDIHLASATYTDRFELVFTYDNLLDIKANIDENLIQIHGSQLILSDQHIGSDIQLIDLFGRIVNTWNNAEQQINFSDYSGCYFVTILSENKVPEIKKVIIP
ncbi:MAG: hypothetical protein HOG05_01220 [Bacteroidetes bacterium]|nr:hypothetical protein [Bacteroidota bacterium]